MKIEPLEPMRAADLVAALRFHKHPLAQQAADRIEELERDVAAEREACAKIAEVWGTREVQMTDTAFVPGASYGERYASSGIAAAIRARGDTPE